MAIKTIFEVSSMPSHSSNSGTQARLGIERRPANVGSSQASASRLKPTHAANNSARLAPMTKPSSTRNRLALMCFQSAPSARSLRVRAISLGAGIW
ncbi:hypothetical protein D3C85_693670 [compost metagenome]